ncbi:alkaline phosphatase family protein [Kutzneria buriramensis]|uniref:Type I phosphodiesterase/nucleotide pyrophosphatase n=1 Tax=Kutzneria buriramensis TaxID=1045776 RepID=A0A3E0HEP9_9PSEU|nr:nucleotide pyrophosphatase/phosphodiesterase family protein [Kutzneria buriramensis]REH42881.1 type I phosphodiesterase/nucleotide pyrophosphatase [Kutzneria buriramensis]
MADTILPRYGERSLCEVTPSLFAALGAAGFDNVLGVDTASSVCLLVIDGLGWELLKSHAQDAPFLTSHAAGKEPLTAGFPSTTATSLASLGTGLTSGQHGIVGYSFAAPDLLHALPWRVDGVDARETLVPEEIQPLPTVFERSGMEVTIAAPVLQNGSGLTRSVLRGGTFRPVFALGDLAAMALSNNGFCYAYHGELDTVGHLYGPGSLAWRLQLNHVDRLVESIATALPQGSLLAVTADHGMVTMTSTVDADTEPALQQGVRLLGGEPRVRHVYTEPGATDDVLASWREVLGSNALVVRREYAIEEGWFGPVSDRVLPRIGDVLAVALGEFAITRTVAESRESTFAGVHGSLTPAEMLVPFLTFAG